MAAKDEILNLSDKSKNPNSIPNTSPGEVPIIQIENQSTKAGVITGYSKGIVNASPAQITAWCWDYCSKERIDSNRETDVNREIVSQDSDHGMTIFHQKWFPKPLVTRDFLFRQVWKRLDDYTMCIIM